MDDNKTNTNSVVSKLDFLKKLEDLGKDMETLADMEEAETANLKIQLDQMIANLKQQA